MKETVWRCDSCRKLLERDTDIYRLDFKSIGRWPDPAGGRSEHGELNIELCQGCARKVTDSLKMLERAR